MSEDPAPLLRAIAAELTRMPLRVTRALHDQPPDQEDPLTEVEQRFVDLERERHRLWVQNRAVELGLGADRE